MRSKASFASQLLAAILVACVLVLAFSTGAGASAHGQQAPQRGGTLTVMHIIDPASYDPVKLSGQVIESPVSISVFDVLFTITPNTAALEPRLATSMTTSDGGTTWTLKLRSNVKFSDATALDANAVMFNWQRIADPANLASSQPLAAQIQTMSVTNPLTLQITLKSPDPTFDYQVAKKMSWIASPTAVKAQGAAFARSPVGAGPFILKSWTQGVETQLVRNPDYWQKGRPYLDALVVKANSDPVQRFNALQTGAANVVQNITDPTIVKQARDAGFQVVADVPIGGGYAMVMNNQKPPFNDPRVRKAIDLAIDRQEFNRIRYQDNPDTLMTTLARKGTRYYDSSIKVPKTNLAEAQKLIDQVVAETGKPVQFTYNGFNSASSAPDAEVLQAQISRLKNVEMKIEQLPSTVVNQRFSSGDYQAGQNGMIFDVPSDLINYFSSKNFAFPFDFARYSNPTVDSTLNKLATTTNEKTQNDLVNSVLQTVAKDSAVAWFARLPIYQILDKTVKNYTNTYQHMPVLADVWIGKAKQ